ncbi:SIP domain-containing protein [Promicromonospora sp. MS192]|uniref:SIP domain-containing protein n=1 Tax=Promicromonospora sp. MS192 TaxID=3412684 RepID=UPI003C2E06B8
MRTNSRRDRAGTTAFPSPVYVCVAGEASFTLATRAHCLSAGVPQARIDFCAYWRPGRSR